MGNGVEMKFGNELEYQLKKYLRRYKRLKGIKLDVKRPELNEEVREALIRGHYEHSEYDIISSILTGNERVLELGTCTGFLACYMAKKCGSENVVSVEANPELTDLIESNCRLNNVSPRLINAIASVEDDIEVPFYIHERVFSSSLKHDEKARKTYQKTIDVNRLINEFRPHVIMMDIEGGETDLLPALELDGVNYLIVEFHPHRCSADEIEVAFNAILSKNYQFNLAVSHDNVFTFQTKTQQAVQSHRGGELQTQ